MADARVGTTPYWFRFIDWPPRQGGTPKPAVIDTWLYIFQVHTKAASLQAEVFLRAAAADPDTGQKLPERYHAVNLKKHWGQDRRPYAEPGTDAFQLDDSDWHVLEDVRYYVLCSPFQLPWKRIKDLANTKAAKPFEKLAREQRGLTMIRLGRDNTQRGPGGQLRIKAIRSPWGDAQALSNQFRSKLREWRARAMSPERRKWRTLLAGIDMMSRGHRFQGLLDEKYLKEEVYVALLKDDQLFHQVEVAANKVILHLRGPAMQAMELDAESTNDPDERGVFAQIRMMAEQRLEQTKLGQEYRRAWYPEHEKLVLFDMAADAQKGFRKGMKFIWAWAKSWADVAAGYPAGSKRAGEVPEVLVGYCRWQAKAFAGVELQPDLQWRERQIEGAQQRARAKRVARLDPIPMKFTRESVAELRAKVNDRLWLTGLFALVDTVNVVFALRALLDGTSTKNLDRTKQVAAAGSGLCSLVMSLQALLKRGVPNLSAEDLTRLMIARDLDFTAHSLLTRYEGFHERWGLVGRAATSSRLNAGLGAAGAALDMIAYSVELGQGLHEAKTGGSPDRIWILPGLGIMGSFVSLVGFALMASNPAGAIVLMLGAALGATATLGSVLSPARVASDVEKWLMHSFVGKYRGTYINEEESFTSGKLLGDYHNDLDLQLAGLNHVLFAFEPKCEIYEEHGQPLLKIDVRFRQLKCQSKVDLKVFGQQKGQWLLMFHSKDWRPVGAPPEDERTHLRQEGPARLFASVSAAGFKKMKIAVQIDVFGDRTFKYPKEAQAADS
jgi:hypothetical protein